MKLFLTKIFKITAIIERSSDMNRIKSKTVSRPTSHQTKLTVVFFFGGGWGSTIHSEKTANDNQHMMPGVN